MRYEDELAVWDALHRPGVIVGVEICNLPVAWKKSLRLQDTC